MEHAIFVLETEAKQLKQCLSEWDLNHYPEARKVRDNKLKSCEKAISLLKESEKFNKSIEGKTE